LNYCVQVISCHFYLLCELALQSTSKENSTKQENKRLQCQKMKKAVFEFDEGQRGKLFAACRVCSIIMIIKGTSEANFQSKHPLCIHLFQRQHFFACAIEIASAAEVLSAENHLCRHHLSRCRHFFIDTAAQPENNGARHLFPIDGREAQ